MEGLWYLLASLCCTTLVIIFFKSETSLIYFDNTVDSGEDFSNKGFIYRLMHNHKHKRLTAIIYTNATIIASALFLILSIQYFFKKELLSSVEDTFDLFDNIPSDYLLLMIVTLLLTILIFLILIAIRHKKAFYSIANFFFQNRFIYFIIFWIVFPITAIIILFVNLFKLVLPKRQDALNSSDNGEIVDINLQKLFETTFYVRDVKEIDNEYIETVLEYSKMQAKEIMTPLIDVVSIDKDENVEKAVLLMADKKYSRIPVYKERVDDLVGYIYMTDLISAEKTQSIGSYIREGYYVPETKRVDELLEEMQSKKLPLVFAVDEYGGTAGIITLYDTARFVFGDLVDDEETAEKIFTDNDIHEIIVNGDTDIDDLEDDLDLNITKEGYETLSGFITYYMGKIPKTGESFEYQDYLFNILEVTEKSIEKVGIRRIEKEN